MPPYAIELPNFCVVVLIGVSGSGKSTFARRHFLPSEVFSSDAFRALVSDDENDQGATHDAFAALHYLADVRLRRRKLVVIDATNVQAESRKPLLELAAAHDCLCVALVLDVPERVCQERNRLRPDRQFGPHVVANQHRQFRQSLRNLKREGFRYVHILAPPQIESAQITRVPLWTDQRTEHGPFDIIGDVHGCYDELTQLLTRLGYAPTPNAAEVQANGEPNKEQLEAETPFAYGAWQHPEARRVIFLGDLVDRGPKVVETVNLVRGMVRAGTALCVPGNHDNKLMRALKGNRVQVSHGLADSLEQIEKLPEAERAAFKRDYIAFADALVSHLWLDGGALCVAHAGMKEAYIGRASGRVREFALYGDTTGETDEFGLPIRYPWAQEYRGRTVVIYGHTPVPQPEWLNNTLNLDTGCVFGGKVTALRWPERELVQVDALAEYATPVNRKEEEKKRRKEEEGEETGNRAQGTGEGNSSFILHPSSLSLQWQHDELLRAEDVLGKRIVETRLLTHVVIPAANAAAALEVMSRFALEPRWLPYLPPTMSPCETAADGLYLERPQEAFAYYRSQGIAQVICQRKHMGSRAIVVVCRDEEAARLRFGATDGTTGVCYTRTGRQFFDNADWNTALLAEINRALTGAGFWEEFATDWVCLDCELMPWNAKAQGLLREQYAPVGAAAKLSLRQALETAGQGVGRGLDLSELVTTLQQRQNDVVRYTAAYGHYCWNVGSVADLRLAPFHLLATEGRTYFDRPHTWHIETLSHLSAHSDLFTPTETRIVELDNETSQREATDWWEELTGAGGEGMVVKPQDWIVRGPKGLAQPAVKVRGREYLRIIYGPEYTEPANLSRLRQRGLGTKRSLALREFSLGVEGLERFVRREPLRRVHECVFGVLALESEPVDPRL